MAEQKRKVNF